MKRIICLLLSAIVIFSLIPGVSAAENGCSIEVLVKYNGSNINGGKLKAVRVGYVDETDRVFRRLTDHKEIENIGTQKAVSAMVEYYNDNKKDLKVITVDVSKGKALFDELYTGLYLIFQHDAAAGYNNLAPFLVTVPYTVDGEEIYDVTVESKSELKREPKKPSSGGGGGGGGGHRPGNKLPQTGQLTWPIPVLAVSGMTMFAIGWWLCFGRRKDSYEK